jgi:hypothetical protein
LSNLSYETGQSGLVEAHRMTELILFVIATAMLLKGIERILIAANPKHRKRKR